jgi:hypothetical protein
LQSQAGTQGLQALIAKAEKLSGAAGDPKLAVLVSHVGQLLSEGYAPVVFCRYVATANYVAGELKKHFPDAVIEAVTGELVPEERRERVELMGEADAAGGRVLVATDCLSEGINLQHLFTAVVHYDLAWNPTRHEQREGRVDRYGQRAPEVRCTMLYGQNNPVDGFVLKVILRKGDAIQKELGVLVPMPEDHQRINQALVKAALMKRPTGSGPQLGFDFDEPEQLLAPLQVQWEDALDKARSNRTVFAQRGVHPAEVLPEWHKQQEALGSQADVQRFVASACARLNAPLERHRGQCRLHPQHLPQALRMRLADEGLAAEGSAKPLVLDLEELHRSHPVVSLLAEYLIETALQGESSLAARCAATVSADVDRITTVVLLRLRHQLSYQQQKASFQMLAEECLALAIRGRQSPEWLTGPDAARLLECVPAGNLPRGAAQREVARALEALQTERPRLDALAEQRAAALRQDHERVRQAAGRRIGAGAGQHQVQACLPADVVGVYVLLPDAV